jgi:predicted membrane channel-forming protein YqfA (hemolysin III family)
MSESLSTTTANPRASRLDYTALFFDYLLVLIAFHGLISLTPIIFKIPLRQQVVAFGFLLVSSAIGFVGGMFSSVRRWDSCVTIWHFFTLLFFGSEVLAGGSILLLKYFEEKGM